MKAKQYIAMGIKYDSSYVELQKLNQQINKKNKNNKVILKGEIIKILRVGAIVKYKEESFFLHISKISTEYIANIHDVLKVGDKVDFKVIGNSNNIKGKYPEISLLL